MGTASIHPSDDTVQQIFLGDRVKIGKNCRIHPHVTLMAGVTIGDSVEISPGRCLPQCRYRKQREEYTQCLPRPRRIRVQLFRGSPLQNLAYGIRHRGRSCGIGSETCIDGGTFGPTVIGKGTKIDNQFKWPTTAV